LEVSAFQYGLLLGFGNTVPECGWGQGEREQGRDRIRRFQFPWNHRYQPVEG
jgi:hypothetical protein